MHELGPRTVEVFRLSSAKPCLALCSPHSKSCTIKRVTKNQLQIPPVEVKLRQYELYIVLLWYWKMIFPRIPAMTGAVQEGLSEVVVASREKKQSQITTKSWDRKSRVGSSCQRMCTLERKKTKPHSESEVLNPEWTWQGYKVFDLMVVLLHWLLHLSLSTYLAPFPLAVSSSPWDLRHLAHAPAFIIIIYYYYQQHLKNDSILVLLCSIK